MNMNIVRLQPKAAAQKPGINLRQRSLTSPREDISERRRSDVYRDFFASLFLHQHTKLVETLPHPTFPAGLLPPPTADNGDDGAMQFP
jgi:hypothetical protein